MAIQHHREKRGPRTRRSKKENKPLAIGADRGWHSEKFFEMDDLQFSRFQTGLQPRMEVGSATVGTWSLGNLRRLMAKAAMIESASNIRAMPPRQESL